MDTSLKDKVVAITGASSGIGAATARRLAAEGCKLVLAARSEDRLRAVSDDLDTDTLPVPTDVTVGDDVKRMVERALEHFGRIDVMFANAGIYIPGQVVEGDPEDWANLMRVNVDGVMRCAHAVLPSMIEQGSGDILVTSSISGFVDIHWEPIYSASKHAIQGFVHTLRRQVSEQGIRVGSIAPGRVANELWGTTNREDVDQQVAERISLRSEDVAEAVVFALSRPAHITIRDLVIVPANQDL